MIVEYDVTSDDKYNQLGHTYIFYLTAIEKIVQPILYGKGEQNMYQIVEKVYEKDLVIVNEMPQEDLNIIMSLHYSKTISEKLELIGTGEFGRVYAYKSLSGKEYAIKIEKEMHEKNYGGQTFDATILSKLQGIKYIPKLYAHIGEDFLIVDRVKGVTIEAYKDGQTRGIYPREDFVFVFEKTIDNIFERSIRPSDLHLKNIMINDEGLPIMVDFGHWEDYTNSPIKPSKSSVMYRIINLKDFYENYNYKAQERRREFREELFNKINNNRLLAI